MSIAVNELQDFRIEIYNGNLVAINIEDLRFIRAQANADMSLKRVQHRILTFVYLNPLLMLVMDELNPYVQKLANDYIVRLALPAESLDFALGFVRRGVTPAPAAIALRDALQVNGCNGPRVSSLSQMNMYKIVLDNHAIADSVAGVDLTDVTNSITSLTSRTTALEKQISVQIEWS